MFLNYRALDNPEAENVAIVWKAFLDNEDQQISEDVHIDAILNDRRSLMCGNAMTTRSASSLTRPYRPTNGSKSNLIYYRL